MALEKLDEILAANPDLSLNLKVREISDNLEKVQQLNHFAASEVGVLVLTALRNLASSVLTESLAHAVGNRPQEATNALLRLSAHLSLLAEFGSLGEREIELRTLLSSEIEQLVNRSAA